MWVGGGGGGVKCTHGSSLCLINMYIYVGVWGGGVCEMYSWLIIMCLINMYIYVGGWGGGGGEMYSWLIIMCLINRYIYVGGWGGGGVKCTHGSSLCASSTCIYMWVGWGGGEMYSWLIIMCLINMYIYICGWVRWGGVKCTHGSSLCASSSVSPTHLWRTPPWGW